MISSNDNEDDHIFTGIYDENTMEDYYGDANILKNTPLLTHSEKQYII